MGYCFLDIFHQFHRYDQIQILRVKFLFSHKLTGNDSADFFCSSDFYLVFGQFLIKNRQKFLCDFSVNEQCFYCITCCSILSFSINNNRDCFLLIIFLIYINMTDSICVTHNRDFCMIHNILYKLIRTSWD